MKQAKINATLTGFIIGMILVAMFGSIFALLMSQMSSEYSIDVNGSFEKYENYTQELVNHSNEIRDATDISQQEGILDVIGGYFSAGYSAIKTAITSFDLFDTMMDDASSDFEELSFIKTYIVMIITILLFVGVIIAVLVKWAI